MFCSVQPHYDIEKVFHPLKKDDSSMFVTILTEKRERKPALPPPPPPPKYVAPPIVIPEKKKIVRESQVAPLMMAAQVIEMINPIESQSSAGYANFLGLSPGITYAGDTPLYATYNPSENADKWSFYPAIQDVNMANFSLSNVSSIIASQGIFDTLNTTSFTCYSNAIFQSTTTVTQALTFRDGTSNDILKAEAGNLFFNNELLARAGDIQDIADWALYPALSTIEVEREFIRAAGGAYIDLYSCIWNGKIADQTILLNAADYVQIGLDDSNNSSLLVNDISAIGKANGTDGQFLSHDADTIVWVAAPSAANWANYAAVSTIDANNNDIVGVQKINGIAYPPTPTTWANYPAVSTINADNNDIVGVLKINGIAYPPPASGVTSVNGQTGAVTITGDVSTITATLIGTDTQLGAPTLGTSGDLYPVNDTSWGKANYASLNATSAGLAAGGAATAAAAAQASADAAAITAAAALADATLALSQSGITSVNGGSFATTIAAGSGIGVVTTFSSGTTNPTVTISATGTAGVTTLNTLSGALTLAAGTGISVTPSGGNTLTVANTAPGTSFVASYDIYVAPNGNDTTGTGSANNPYLTIAKAITVRATLSLSNEVSIRLASGTYAESAILIANTYLVGVVTGEADQPVNITGNITMSGATGQSGIVGLQLNAPTNGANVTISGAGTFAINNCNITAGTSAVAPVSYILNHSSTGTCYMTECRMTCSPTSSVEGIFGSATLIMRDCFMGTAGPASMILYQGNLTVRQCNLVNTSTSVGVNAIIQYTPLVLNRTCEVSYCVLQYTSAATAALKGCIVVSNGAATALVNIVNNLLICEGTTNGTGPNNYHCIWKTASSAGNACSMSYGNLLAGATAHNIDANITKTQFNAVP